MNYIHVSQNLLPDITCTKSYIHIYIYTYLSIGLTIRGMENRPAAITLRDLDWGVMTFVRSNSHLVEAHILLIVSPGMATDARPCHKRVSTIEITGLSSESYNRLYQQVRQVTR